MEQWLAQLSPVVQALCGTGFTWFLTALGAGLVFFFKRIERRVMDGMLGFAAGVMIAASYWSLLAPAIEMVESDGGTPWIPPLVGFLGGGLFLWTVDKILPHLHPGFPDREAEGIKTSWQRSVLLVLAITLHNIPEGLAVGVAFGAAAAGHPAASLGAAIALAIGIGIQNFPEGAAVSVPLRREGMSRTQEFHVRPVLRHGRADRRRARCRRRPAHAADPALRPVLCRRGDDLRRRRGADPRIAGGAAFRHPDHRRHGRLRDHDDPRRRPGLRWPIIREPLKSLGEGWPMNAFAGDILAAIQQILPAGISPPALLLLLAAICLVMGFAALAGAILLVGQKRRRREAELRLAAAEDKTVLAEKRSVEQQIRAEKLITLLKNERKHAAEKLQLLEDAREELSLRFAHLAQQIFEEKSARFSELNKDRLEAILQPFNHQLTAFKQEINEIYRTDSRERLSLKGEILQLRDLNQQINREAINLTRALKSDTKVQGNWGELVLDRVLEKSGLRLGQEYHTQGGFRDPRQPAAETGCHHPSAGRPGYYRRLQGLAGQLGTLCQLRRRRRNGQGIWRQLVKAVRDHVATLGGKNYPGLAGIHSLDFVLMFMPIEAAFAAVFQHDDSTLYRGPGQQCRSSSPPPPSWPRSEPSKTSGNTSSKARIPWK